MWRGGSEVVWRQTLGSTNGFILMFSISLGLQQLTGLPFLCTVVF